MPMNNDQAGVRDDRVYRPPSEEEPQIRLEDVVERLRSAFPQLGRLGGGGGMSLLVIAVLVIAVVLWLASGIYTVAPAQQAANQLFGKYVPPAAGPGLHWWWPGPIGTRNVVAVEEIRRLELGFRSTAAAGGAIQPFPLEAQMITGDLNIIDVQVVVQYRIKDLEAFLFKVDDPGDPERGVLAGSPEGLTLKDAMEASMRQVVGQRSIDDVLTKEKEAAQAATVTLVQSILDDYNTGIEVLEVRLQNVRPPDDVRDAFDDVVRARVDKEARINEALANQQDQLPKARGEARRVVNNAEAFKQERILNATGEADRFMAVLAEYKESQEVTRRRLYLEAMEEILPGITKFIMTEEAAGGVLPFLPLAPGGVTTASGAAGGGQ